MKLSVAADRIRMSSTTMWSIRPSAIGFYVIVGVAYILMLLPVVTVVVTSFFADEIVSFPPSGLTFHWYINMWHRSEFIRAMLTSAEVAILATAIGAPVGTAAAYGIVRGRLRGKGILNALLMGPLTVPGIVSGTALYLAFLRYEAWLDTDLLGTIPVLISAHILLVIPWTVRLVSSSLMASNRDPEEAAVNLGASKWTVMWRVTIPELRSGVVAAVLFSFIASFENLELSLFLVGPERTTLPIAMLSYLEFRVDPTLAAVATVQIAIVAALMLISDKFVALSRPV
jgi:putative spermidine/putrescine transport system permease protein